MNMNNIKYHQPTSLDYREMRHDFGVTRSELAKFLQIERADIQQLEDEEFGTDELREKIENVFKGENASPELLRFWRDKSRHLQLLVLYILRGMQETELLARCNIFDIEEGPRCYKLDLESANAGLEGEQFLRSRLEALKRTDVTPSPSA